MRSHHRPTLSPTLTPRRPGHREPPAWQPNHSTVAAIGEQLRLNTLHGQNRTRHPAVDASPTELSQATSQRQLDGTGDTFNGNLHLDLTADRDEIRPPIAGQRAQLDPQPAVWLSLRKSLRAGWNRRHLLRLLREYEDFYNRHHPHQAIGQTAPVKPRPDNIIDLDTSAPAEKIAPETSSTNITTPHRISAGSGRDGQRGHEHVAQRLLHRWNRQGHHRSRGEQDVSRPTGTTRPGT